MKEEVKVDMRGIRLNFKMMQDLIYMVVFPERVNLKNSDNLFY